MVKVYCKIGDVAHAARNAEILRFSALRVWLHIRDDTRELFRKEQRWLCWAMMELSSMRGLYDDARWWFEKGKEALRDKDIAHIVKLALSFAAINVSHGTVSSRRKESKKLYELALSFALKAQSRVYRNMCLTDESVELSLRGRFRESFDLSSVAAVSLSAS